MRHSVTTLLPVLIFVTATSSALGAQAKPASTAQAQRALPTNRWVTRPTPITLTADQRKELDSISAQYAEEEQQVSKHMSAQSEMDFVLKMQNLSTKYQNMVRGILSPAQRAVFDKNIQTSAFGP